VLAASNRNYVAPRPARHNDWKAFAAPKLGAWSPALSVSVVIPAKNCQPQLDLTLAALSEQTYPDDLLDVVVVDDASEPALHLPKIRPGKTRLIRLEAAEGHGSGRGRHAGAQASAGEVILFLDADMVALRDHVEAHARWHHVLADAVVLGYKHFVDVAGVTVEEVRLATRHDTFSALLGDRRWRRHEWVEEFIKESNNLLDAGEDAFLAVVGATVSVPRRLYEASGGFASFGLRGIVDTEFGYRVFTAGATLVPEPAARSIHQGLRNFATRGDDIKRERVGLAANHLPIAMFRPLNRGRVWTVPQVCVQVPVGDAGGELVLLTVDSLLASSFTDLKVTVRGYDASRAGNWLRDYYAAEKRVSFAADEAATGFPSPYTLVVPAGAALGPDTVGWLLDELRAENLGLVRSTVPGSRSLAAELWATRALHRARRHARAGEVEAVATHLFGSVWRSGEALGIHMAEPAVTRQGMIYDGWSAGEGAEPATS
jgi:GT2 family glycosyltransferase